MGSGTWELRGPKRFGFRRKRTRLFFSREDKVGKADLAGAAYWYWFSSCTGKSDESHIWVFPSFRQQSYSAKLLTLSSLHVPRRTCASYPGTRNVRQDA